MSGAQKLYGVFVSAIALLAIVAAWSRISTMPQVPSLISGGSNALVRLFNGVFGL